jgi:hypothetical protein
MNKDNIYEAGFYKIDGGLLYAPNSVEGSGFCLYKEIKDSYTYPVEGWYWLNNKIEVYAQFNLKDDEETI